MPHSQSRLEIFDEAVLCDGVCWNPQERLLYEEVPSVQGEGVGERAYRHHMGYDLSPVGVTGRVDVPLGSTEIKCILSGKNSGKFRDEFRFGTIGTRAWGKMRSVLAEFPLPEEEKILIESGEISTKKFSALSCYQAIRDSLDPEYVLGREFDKLVLVSPLGFLSIPKIDFSLSLLLKRISQGSPKYELSKDYIILRSMKVL